MKKRIPTDYPGVFYRLVDRAGNRGQEKTFIVVVKIDGKTYEETVGKQFKNNMTAAKASGIRADILEGKRLLKRHQKEKDAARMPLDRLWRRFAEQKSGLKSHRDDKSRYETHLSPALGKKTVEELAPLDVDRIRIHLLKKQNLAPQTVKHVLLLLQRIINWGFQKRLCPALSFKIEMPRFDNQKTEDLTPDELKRLLDVLDNGPEGLIVARNMMKLALYTGMRRGELFALEWGHIDFERGFIAIGQGGTSKGGKVSQIPLNNIARNLLENIMPTDGSPYVFAGQGGKKRQDIYHSTKRIIDLAKLPKGFRPLHALRHVYASMLASSGKVDLYTLQKLLTHKSPQMTQRYAHLRDDALQRAAGVADEIFEQTRKGEESKEVVNLEDYRK